MSSMAHCASIICLLSLATSHAASQCDSISCQNSGTCVAESQTVAHCVCSENFFGDSCEYNSATELCHGNPCSSHGRCGQQHNEASMECLCDPGYYGTYCQFEYNECSSNPCVHGLCIDGVATYACDCNGTVYSGINCENQHIPHVWLFLVVLLIPLGVIVYATYRGCCRQGRCKQRRSTPGAAYVILDDNPYGSDGYSLPMTQRSR